MVEGNPCIAEVWTEPSATGIAVVYGVQAVLQLCQDGMTCQGVTQCATQSIVSG